MAEKAIKISYSPNYASGFINVSVDFAHLVALLCQGYRFYHSFDENAIRSSVTTLNYGGRSACYDWLRKLKWANQFTNDLITRKVFRPFVWFQYVVIDVLQSPCPSLTSYVTDGEYTHDYLMRMATVGCFVSEGRRYKVYVHGDTPFENNPIPHIHVIAEGTQSYVYDIKFDLELSLLDILCRQKYTILNLKVDGEKVRIFSDDWSGYIQLKKDLSDFLNTGPIHYFGVRMIDNLHYCIWRWNNEDDCVRGPQGINVLAEFMRTRGIKPKKKYESYLRDLT